MSVIEYKTGCSESRVEEKGRLVMTVLRNRRETVASAETTAMTKNRCTVTPYRKAHGAATDRPVFSRLCVCEFVTEAFKS